MYYLDFEYRNLDSEFEKVKSFLTELQYFENHDNNWDPSRFDWWRYSYHHDKAEAFFIKNAHYWTLQDGEVVALAISEYGENDLFMIVHPKHKALYESVIDWAINTFGEGKSEIRSSIFLNDTYKISQLEARGFVKDKHENNVRTYDLDEYDFSYDLTDGYRLVTFSEYMDYEEKSKLICSAFSKPKHPIERIKSFMKTPGYMSDLDLIVINGDNKPVAYCTAWIEQYDGKLGYIEPMGTHADFRRMGFGTALAKEGFSRLHDKGVRLATIASNAEPDISNLLYDSLGPIAKKSGYEFVLKL